MADDFEDIKRQENRELQEKLLSDEAEKGSICLWCKHGMLMQIDVPDPRYAGQPGIIGVPRAVALQTICLKAGMMPMNPMASVRACEGWVLEEGGKTLQNPTIELKSENLKVNFLQ